MGRVGAPARRGLEDRDADLVWLHAIASDDASVQFHESFRRTLAQHGWIEGKNVSFEYRSARGDPPQFAEPAAELVRLEVDVIYTENAPATRAAYAATRTIPFVAIDFTNDPVAAGYAQSYSRPGGNLTGLFLDAPEFAGKWLELLKAMVPPGLSRVAVLWDPSPGTTHLQAVQAAAPSFGVKLQVLKVHTPDDLDRAFSAFRGRPQALIILPSPLTYSQSVRLAKLATKHRLLRHRLPLRSPKRAARSPTAPSRLRRSSVVLS